MKNDINAVKIKLAVLFGGQSVEHEVSVITALQAIESLNKDKYEIIPIYITKNNEMYCGDFIGNIEEYKDIPSLLKKSLRVYLLKNGAGIEIITQKKLKNKTINNIDIIFPMGHGTNVEDGILQGYLKFLGVPYVGCDVCSAAAGMNKYIMKAVFKNENIPILECERALISEFIRDKNAVIQRLKEKINFPMIIKPINLGSSVGIKIAHDKDSLEEALEHAFLFSEEVLAERAIINLKEINVSVLGDIESAEASECEEPLSNSDILSYEEKYVNGGKNSGMASLTRKIPADISEEQRETIRKLAVEAFKSLGCNGVARIDFMINLDDDSIYLNEINTLPGSLAFYLWEPVGLKYSDLLEKMIELALKRERKNKTINFSFDSNILSNAKIGGMKGKLNGK